MFIRPIKIKITPLVSKISGSKKRKLKFPKYIPYKTHRVYASMQEEGVAASFNRGERLVYDRLPVGNVFLIHGGAYTMIASGVDECEIGIRPLRHV